MTEGSNVRLLDVLSNTAHDLVVRLDADACVISRVVGDVLLIVTHATADGRRLNFGQGFLLSDYPQTAAVLRTGEPCALTLADADVDEAEAALLRDLGFASLLMLPLDLGGERWGLVELYRRDTRRIDAAAARELLVV